jgi:hypothetical protein
LYGEWNTKYSASEIENCSPLSFSYLFQKSQWSIGKLLFDDKQI